MRLTFAAALVAVLIVPVARSAPHHPCAQARAGIVFYQRTTHSWQARHDAPLTRSGNAARSPGCAYVRWAAHRWQQRSRVARHDYQIWFRAMYAKWECIHLLEGSWSAHNGGYGGGLQMDGGFQGTYGSEFVAAYGAAGSWPVWAQLLAAERAFHGYPLAERLHPGAGKPRGFAPWPNTSRACGLL